MMKEYHENNRFTNNSENKSGLLESDYEDFQRCFISKEIVDLAGYERVNDLRGSEITGQKRIAGRDFAGRVAPIRHPKTNQILEWELRRDNPDEETRSDGSKKQIRKYLRPPGSKSLPYFVPKTKPEMLEDTEFPLIITEGLKKALAMLNAVTDNLQNPLNYLITALQGVYNSKTDTVRVTDYGEKKIEKDLLPGLREIELRGRPIIIVFDANVLTNRQVFNARYELAKTMTAQGGIVYLVTLPVIDGINGIDDLLGKWERDLGRAAAIAKFESLLKTKRRFKPNTLFSVSLAAGRLYLKLTPGERGKFSVTASDADDNPIALDVFNLSDSAKRNGFIKQLSEIIELSNNDKADITRELIRLASLSHIIVESEEVLPTGETIETSFQTLKDGRVIEQIKTGFAVYDPEKDEHSVSDSVTDSDGTIYRPIEDDLFQKAGGIQLAEELTEYGTEAELIAEIQNYLSRYLDLKPLQLALTALYILFTYICDLVLELSYLHATGDPGSGKSRFGQTVSFASHRGLALITPSAASLYRIVDKFKPTLFIDEFNSNANSDDAAAVIQILNAGFQRTAQIPRQVASPDGKFRTEMFDAFCPKIIGSLKQSESNAFNSRCIEIQMERTTRNDIPLRLSHGLLNDAQKLRNKLTLWRLRNIQNDFEAKLDKAEKELKQSGIMPRSIQINIPLFALINDEGLKDEFIRLLKGRDEVLFEEKSRSIDGEIVHAFHNILFKSGYDALNDEDTKEAVWKIERPTEGKPCEDLRIEKLTSMLNDNRKEKEHLNEKYVGKKVSGLGLRSAQILSRKSDYHKKSAVIFDSHRLTVVFRNYGLPVPSDFSLDQLDQNNKPNKDSGLDWSKDNFDNVTGSSFSDQVKPNNYNNNREWSNWSKENTGKDARNTTPTCSTCSQTLDLIENDNLWFCPFGCGSVEAQTA